MNGMTKIRPLHVDVVLYEQIEWFRTGEGRWFSAHYNFGYVYEEETGDLSSILEMEYWEMLNN